MYNKILALRLIVRVNSIHGIKLRLPTAGLNTQLAIQHYQIYTIILEGVHHSIGDDAARSPAVGREQALGVARAHDESLVLLQQREVVHQQPELGPVGEHLSVASIRDQLVGKLCTMWDA